MLVLLKPGAVVSGGFHESLLLLCERFDMACSCTRNQTILLVFYSFLSSSIFHIFPANLYTITFLYHCVHASFHTVSLRISSMIQYEKWKIPSVLHYELWIIPLGLQYEKIFTRHSCHPFSSSSAESLYRCISDALALKLKSLSGPIPSKLTVVLVKRVTLFARLSRS